MTTRSRGYNQDWDPMREDFDNSSYDPQAADDSASGFANLDHCRLYITNIPNGLSDEGLATAFSKYGQLTEIFVSKNPDKRYALVAFETSGEAKFAMMKLNRMEPLRLNINIAYKSNAKHKRPVDKKDNSGYRSNNSNAIRNRDDRSFRDDVSAGSHNTRRQESLANGDNMEDLADDDVQVLSGGLEPDVNLQLEKLKLEHLKLQEAQVLCKHRMLLLKQAEKKSSTSSRQILPDGRIVVRTIEKNEVNDADGSFGAGDAPNLPGLQSAGACVACGERAAAFCSGCRVTPYCSPACQRRDWQHRHRTVCHNLKRQSGGVASRLEPEPELVAPAALRRPRSPAVRDPAPDRMPPKKFVPAGASAAQTPVVRANNARAGGGSDRSRRDGPGPDNRRSDNREQADRAGGRAESRGQADRGRFNRSNQREQGDDRPSGRANDRNKENSARTDDRPGRARNQDGGHRGPGGQAGPRPSEDEDWGPKPTKKPEEPEPSFAFKPKTPAVRPEETAPEPKPAAPEPGAAPPLVPENCVVELLRVGDEFMLSVEESAESGGWLCVAGHAEHCEGYERLLEPFAAACEASQPARPQPGETFAQLSPDDGGWFRARLLSRSRAALLDAARAVPLAPGARRLPPAYAALPEYSALLASDRVQLNDQVQCTIVSKSGDVLHVSLVNMETGAALGSGTVQRWLPAVEPAVAAAPAAAPAPATAPAPAPATAPTSAPASAATASGPSEPPQVPRPAVSDGGRVVLVDATAPDRVFVRPAGKERQAEFDDLLCEVAMYGADESRAPLTELPTPGQAVLARFSDGVHYRALVQRVNSRLRRCLLEFLEYGNAMVVEDLSALSECPEHLSPRARPTPTARVQLQLARPQLSAAAAQHLERLKDEGTELTLTIPSGEKTAPSNTAVRLTVADTKDDVNRTLDALSTPEWQKLLERGGDVLETESLTFNDIKYAELPASGGELEILDSSLLSAGMLNGHLKNAEHARQAFALTPLLQEYCNSALAKDPYLPKAEELCIAMCPIKQQWLRAVFLQQEGGPGGAHAQLLFYDHGHMAAVPVAAIRKMMPEFARVPAAVCTLVVEDFPASPSPQQLARARAHVRGGLRVEHAAPLDVGEWRVRAPALLAAL